MKKSSNVLICLLICNVQYVIYTTEATSFTYKHVWVLAYYLLHLSAQYKLGKMALVIYLWLQTCSICQNIQNTVNIYYSFIMHDCPLQINSVTSNTSWKINLFMMFSDHKDEVLKGVSGFLETFSYYCSHRSIQLILIKWDNFLFFNRC